MHRPQRQAGGTLMEAMVTIAVAAVILTVGVPSLLNVVQDQRLSAALTEIVASLKVARSEAIKRGMRVTVCPSVDRRRCRDSAVWESGWIVFVDQNGNGQVDNGDRIVRVGNGVSAGTLRGSRKRITYQSRGFSVGFNDTLRMCDARGNTRGRSIVVSNQGRVRVSPGTTACP